jgi:hypothetical protein
MVVAGPRCKVPFATPITEIFIKASSCSIIMVDIIWSRLNSMRLAQIMNTHALKAKTTQ